MAHLAISISFDLLNNYWGFSGWFQMQKLIFDMPFAQISFDVARRRICRQSRNRERIPTKKAKYG